MNEKADALDALLKSEGWKLFSEFAAKEWGPAACWRKAISRGGDAEAMRVIDATNVNVGMLMNWPQEEIARLRRAEAEPEQSMSRGGYR